jgi:predicted ATPase/DNA-binding winged helix-turn-helix (wHTH) protein
MPIVDHDNPESRDAVSFGPFRLTPHERLLERAGVAVPLGGRALDILIVLVERAGKVVSKRDLIARAWPDITVDEGSLRFHVGALRKALGDGEAGARYVTNVPGRGYCFVERISYSTPSPPAEIESPAFDQDHRLPTRLMRMVGRDEIVQAISSRLLADRFVTIVGPGGIGKTTVVVSAAHALLAEFSGAVRFIDLGTLSDPLLVASNLASTLGLPVGSDNAIPTLINYLRDKRMLLVFDSCEHVIETVAALAETIFMEVPLIHILATSREPLRVEGEHIHRLFPLDYPPDDADLTALEALDFPAVQLFLGRMAASTGEATLSDEDARIVGGMCRKLDGIALAIELAAGRVSVHGISGTAALLDGSLGLLWQGRRTAPPRHQTLMATLDWSYNLLPETERVMLRRLAVFAGGFSLEAARAVLSDLHASVPGVFEGLASLVAKSLVAADVGGPNVTYRLLDTTRAYGLEKLRERHERDDASRRHAEYYLALFDGAEADWGACPMSEWLETYARQIDNLRAALDWAFSSTGEISLGIALTIASGLLWFQLSLIDECRQRFGRALSYLERPDADLRQRMRLLALRSCVVSNSTLADGRNPLSVVLDLAETLGDEDHRALALWALWASHKVLGTRQQSVDYAVRFRAAVAASGDASYHTTADWMFAMMAQEAGDLAEARAHIDRTLDRRPVPVVRAQLIHHHMNQYVMDRSLNTILALLQGFPDRAMEIEAGNYTFAASTGHALSEVNLLRQSACPVALYVGDLAQAERYIGRLIELSERHNFGIFAAIGWCFHAMLANRRGNIAAGLPALRIAIDKYIATGFGLLVPLIVGDLAETLGDSGDVVRGQATIDEAFGYANADSQHWLTPELLRIRGRLRHAAGNVVEAEDDFRQAIKLAGRQGALFWELRAARSMAELFYSQNRTSEGKDVLSAVYGRFTEGFERADLRAANSLLGNLAG